MKVVYYKENKKRELYNVIKCQKKTLRVNSANKYNNHNVFLMNEKCEVCFTTKRNGERIKTNRKQQLRERKINKKKLKKKPDVIAK